MINDDASQIVDQWSEAPSSTIEQRSEEASEHGRDGSGALLGLELTTIENSGQNPALDEDSKQFAAQSPLLGTITLKSLSKSSNRRSTQRVCNDSLLRFGSSVEARKSQNSAENRTRGCYDFTPENLPKGMCIRGGQFYYRRNVPKDAQGLIGRTEIWRSLRTDSLKAAVRRVHGVAAQIEAYIESARSTAGLSFDETLLRPFTDDPRPALAHAAASVRQVAPTSDPSIEGRPEIAAVTLGQAYEQYLNDPAHSWSARTRDAFETSRKMAVAVIGADTPLMTLSRAQCRDYIEVLRFLPRNAAKRFPKLTPRQASDQSRGNGGRDTISVANVNVYLGNLSSFLNWAVNEELIGRNRRAHSNRMAVRRVSQDMESRYPVALDQ